MKQVLITGGAGFFGTLLKNRLLDLGIACVSIDLQPDETSHALLTNIQGDIAERNLMEQVFTNHRFDAIFHIAAILAHDRKNRSILWRSNVDATALLAEMAKKHQVAKLIYTSSNCIFSRGQNAPLTEQAAPCPIEIYGASKLAAEDILHSYGDHFQLVTIRCPTIIAASRLGLLAILFEFMEEGRKVWVVGAGDNRYQFIYAYDLIDACLRAANSHHHGIYNIGSDHVKSMREIYESVIEKAGSRSKVCSLPKAPILLAMRLASWLKISPLGPYHYSMIAESFIFDTKKIKSDLGWKPTKTNEEMLFEAYRFYVEQKSSPSRFGLSAHRQPARMGIIRLLKWLS
jgi:nucleoside-diphosphate-sugar epimerase